MGETDTREKRIPTTRVAGLLLAGGALAMAAALAFSGWIGERMVRKYAPLIDAATQVKYEATLAHLWLEEWVTGDRFLEVEEIWVHMDRADDYARAMLEGGEVGAITFIAVGDPAVRAEIERVRLGLQQFRQVAEVRLEAGAAGAIGSDVDQRFDAIFLEFLQRADTAESQLQRAMGERLQIFRTVQVALLVATLVLAGSIGAFLLYCIRFQERSHRTLTVANDRIRNQMAELEVRNVELRDRQRVLERVRSELARSNADLEQFAYVASHDLQEPLRLVENFTELLRRQYRDKLDDTAAKYIDTAVSEARRMQVLVRDLLVFSRVDAEAGAAVPVESASVFDQVARLFADQVKSSRAQLTREALPRVLADPIQLRQVFENLIGNALKFSGSQPPHVHVAARLREGLCEFSVEDQGIGIDPQDADRVFEMFRRLHPPGHHPGSGIGLAVVKKIVERAGGRIWLAPHSGPGATFRFTVSAASG